MSVASVASVAFQNLPPPAGPAPANPVPALPPPAGPVSVGMSASNSDSGAQQKAAIEAARLALANANSLVETDERNHSPSCTAVDQKLVDKAQIALTQAQGEAGSTLDVSM